MKMIICAALLPIGLVLAASGLISLVRKLGESNLSRRTAHSARQDNDNDL